MKRTLIATAIALLIASTAFANPPTVTDTATITGSAISNAFSSGNGLSQVSTSNNLSIATDIGSLTTNGLTGIGTAISGTYGSGLGAISGHSDVSGSISLSLTPTSLSGTGLTGQNATLTNVSGQTGVFGSVVLSGALNPDHFIGTVGANAYD